MRNTFAGLRSLGLCQSAAINIHPDCSGMLHRILNAGVPDPTFPNAHTKRKVVVWLRETSAGVLPCSSAGICSQYIASHMHV